MIQKLSKFLVVFSVIAVMSVGLSSCSLTLPVTATSNPVGQKVGTATATGFFSILFFAQDAGIQKAARSAGITKVSTVDIKTTYILGIVTIYETIVTGD